MRNTIYKFLKLSQCFLFHRKGKNFNTLMQQGISYEIKNALHTPYGMQRATLSLYHLCSSVKTDLSPAGASYA